MSLFYELTDNQEQFYVEVLLERMQKAKPEANFASNTSVKKIVTFSGPTTDEEACERLMNRFLIRYH